jgi:hypothetical protein
MITTQKIISTLCICVCLRKHSALRWRGAAFLQRRLTHANWIFVDARLTPPTKRKREKWLFFLSLLRSLVAFWPRYCARSVVKAKIPLAVAWNNTRGDTLLNTRSPSSYLHLISHASFCAWVGECMLIF